jgi:hypothetical protein
MAGTRRLPPELDERQARRILAEAADRAKRKVRLVPEESLFGAQLAFATTKSKRALAVCSRRAGKSYSVAMRLLMAGFQFPHSLPVYITMSRAGAKNIVWPALIDLNEKFDLGLQFKQNSGDVVLPNGSKILLRGAGSFREIDKLRGPKYPIAVVDEAQGFGPGLTYLLQEVLEPATLDYNGSLVVTGTPNAACAGPFFEMATDSKSSWEVHSWTLLDNPHLPDPHTWLANLRAERGWSEDTSAYLREYCGKWVRDAEGLVFALDSGRNVCTTFDTAGVDDWMYVLGIDLGWNDPTAFCVVAYSPTRKEKITVESYKEGKLTVSAAAAHIEALKECYPFYKIVADTGGYGKGYVESWNKDYGLGVEAAKKVDKATHIEFLNSDLRAGVMKIASDKNQALLDEARLLQWDMTTVQNGKFVTDKRFEDHLCDAWLYASRALSVFLSEPTYNTPKPGDKDYWDWREKQMIKKLEGGDLPFWKKLGNKFFQPR